MSILPRIVSILVLAVLSTACVTLLGSGAIPSSDMPGATAGTEAFLVELESALYVRRAEGGVAMTPSRSDAAKWPSREDAQGWIDGMGLEYAHVIPVVRVGDGGLWAPAEE